MRPPSLKPSKCNHIRKVTYRVHPQPISKETMPPLLPLHYEQLLIPYVTITTMPFELKARMGTLATPALITKP